MTKKLEKSLKMWKLNNILLNNMWVKEEISREIREHFEMNEKKSTTYKNLQDSAKVAFKGQLLPVNTRI